MARPRRQLQLLEDRVIIPLAYGKSAIIDLEDYSRAMHHGWALKDSDPTKEYVHARIAQIDGKHKTLTLHRFILGVTDPTIQVDHINGDGLDNRRVNLRLCDGASNSRNRKKDSRLTLTSRYKGVHRRENGKWRAAIRVNRKLINLGTFSEELDAVRAYNAAAVIYFGEFARVNEL